MIGNLKYLVLVTPFFTMLFTAITAEVVHAELLPGCVNPRPVFKSSFESPVYIERKTSGSQDYFRGADKGYNWDDLPHFFQYVTKKAREKGFVDAYVDTTHAHSGGHSVRMELHARKQGSQNRLQFFGHDSETFGPRIFVRTRFRLDQEIEQSLTKDFDYVSLMGIRRGNSYTIPLTIRRKYGKLYWQLNGINYKAGSKWSDWINPKKGGWTVVNENAPIPKGKRWFTIETYFYRHETSGIVKVWLDGKLIFDVNNKRTREAGSKPHKWFARIADIDGRFSEFPFLMNVDDPEIYACDK